MSNKYTFIDKNLKLKYEKYTKFYLAGVIIGGIFAFNSATIGKLVELTGKTPFYLTWLGYILWIGAILFIVLQSNVKKQDKALKEEANRLLDEEEKAKAQ